MESGSLQFNGISWVFFRIGEATWLLKPKIKKGVLDAIHNTTHLLESEVQQLTDIIPAYDTLTLVFSSSDVDLIKILSGVTKKEEGTKLELKTHKIKVCYELGMDWPEVESKTGLLKEEIVSIHFSKDYKIAMMGFLPGFIFLEGLDSRISVPRKETPRTKIPAGSIGIGGNQTGIYSLESPGGWQIIGRTVESFFDVKIQPPTKFKAGDKIRFKRISVEEYKKLAAEKWVS